MRASCAISPTRRPRPDSVVRRVVGPGRPVALAPWQTRGIDHPVRIVLSRPWISLSVRFGVAGSADEVIAMGLGDKGFATGSPPWGRQARLGQAASARGIACDRHKTRAPICEFDYRIGRP